MLAKTLTTSRTADVSGDPDHPGVSVDPSLEERLPREMLHSERTRMLILAGLFGSPVIVFPALVLVFGQNYARIFGTAWAVQVFAVWSCWPATSWRSVRFGGLAAKPSRTIPILHTEHR